MSRRYGSKVKSKRKWKKISKMNKSELDIFRKSLEGNRQVTSKVYTDVVTRLSLV